MPEPTRVLVVVPPAEIDAATIPEFAERVQRQLEQFPDVLVIDFVDVDFAGAAAVEVLVYAMSVLDSYGGALRIRNVSPALRRLLALSPSLGDIASSAIGDTVNGD